MFFNLWEEGGEQQPQWIEVWYGKKKLLYVYEEKSL